MLSVYSEKWLPIENTSYQPIPLLDENNVTQMPIVEVLYSTLSTIRVARNLF